jgi:hypothetical protein
MVSASVILLGASSATGASNAADVSVFILLGSSPGPNLPAQPGGSTVRVSSRTFAAGVGIRNASPENTTVRFRLELGGGLRWGNDAPDPTEDCTSTETAGECAPPLAFEQTPSLHPLSFVWDVVAPQPGTYSLRAEIVPVSTSDSDQSNNVATLTIVVADAARGSGGGPAVTAGRAHIAPTKPRAGSVVTATVRVLADGAPVRPTRVRCAGTAGSARLRGVARASVGRATCVFRPGASAKRKTLRGSISFRAAGTGLTRRFSVRLR